MFPFLQTLYIMKNAILVIIYLNVAYEYVGCFGDRNITMFSLEVKLEGQYWTRQTAVLKCFKGYPVIHYLLIGTVK